MTTETQRAVIIGAAQINDYRKVASYLNLDEDFLVFCDGGLHHRRQLEVHCGRHLLPNLIVGDFDSHPIPPEQACPIIQLPREKDDTDTWFAVKEALQRGFCQFLLLGVAGQRLDHTMANISILLHLHTIGVPALLVDDFSEMEIVGKKPVQVPATFEYFSLLSVGGQATGVTIRNAQYPLKDAEINCTYQYAVSNQVLPGKVAEITVKRGNVLLLRVFGVK